MKELVAKLREASLTQQAQGNGLKEQTRVELSHETVALRCPIPAAMLLAKLCITAEAIRQGVDISPCH